MLSAARAVIAESALGVTTRPSRNALWNESPSAADGRVVTTLHCVSSVTTVACRYNHLLGGVSANFLWLSEFRTLLDTPGSVQGDTPRTRRGHLQNAVFMHRVVSAPSRSPRPAGVRMVARHALRSCRAARAGYPGGTAAHRRAAAGPAVAGSACASVLAVHWPFAPLAGCLLGIRRARACGWEEFILGPSEGLGRGVRRPCGGGCGARASRVRSRTDRPRCRTARSP